MKNLSITLKLRMTFLGLAAIFVAFGLFAVERLDLVNAQSTEIEVNWMPSIVALSAIDTLVAHYRLNEATHIIATEDEVMRGKEQRMAELRSAIDQGRKQYEPLISSPEERELYNRFSSEYATYQTASDAIVTLSRRNAKKEAGEQLRLSNAILDRMDGILGQLVTLNQNGGIAASRTGDAVFAASRTRIMFGCGAIVVIAIGLMIMFERSVIRPVIGITHVISRLAAGDLGDEVKETSRTDEVGALTQATAVIAATLKDVSGDLRGLIEAAEAGALTVRANADRHQGEYAQLVAGVNTLFDTFTKPLTEVADVMQKVAAGQLSGRMTGAYEGDLRALKANVNRSLDALCSLLGELGGVSGRLSKGDLTTSITGTYQGEFAAIRTNINDAVVQLQHALGEIAVSSHDVAAAAIQTTAAASEVSRQSEAQVITLTQVSAAVEQTASAVREIARNADRGRELAHGTVSRAEGGRDQLRSLIEAVNRIASSNSRINQISDRIGRIAEKTHVLSLNAGIEAARAGEQGLGFGIVAREIGRLAEEASAAANDVSALTVEAAQSVSGGVTSAGEARAAIDVIAESAGESGHTAENIAAAIAQQSAAVEQLSRQVVELREAGQSNAGAAEEINATMGNLSQMIHHVAEQAGRFVV